MGGWVIVKAGVDSHERYLAVSEIAEVRVQDSKNVNITSRSGTVYQWKTDGTMASYAALAKILDLSTNA